MQISLFSNYFNHHQLPFSLAMEAHLGERYTFVATEEINKERLSLGYRDMNREHSFVLPAYDSRETRKKAMALACGTPAIVFATGGCVEVVDETSGIVVPCDDVDRLQEAVIHVCEEKPFDPRACRRRAEAFDMNEKFRDYLPLYEK